MVIRILQLPFIALASAIGMVAVNRIAEDKGAAKLAESFALNPMVAAPTKTIRKSRAVWAWPFVVLGNCVFATRTPRLKVLHRQEWLEWERVLKSRLLNESVPVDSYILVCNKIAGQTLSALLTESTDKQQRIKLIETTTISLAKLHSQTIEIDDAEVSLSHGDAASYNVLIDEATETAEWLDFDLRHDLQEPADARQADDLRALLFSVARFIEPDEIDMVVELVRSSYDRKEIWKQLQRQISKQRFAFDIFHLAQVRRVRSGRALLASHLKIDELVVQAIKK